jgi:hypothetical protein
MPKRKTSRRSRFADDAALQALVRYEPEESGLKALAQQARADYGVSVRQAQTTGDLTLQAAREALSGPGAATLQRGGALEVAQQLGNLRASKAAALEDLNTRAVAARQGQQFGVLQARTKFQSDMAKILGQSQSLGRQRGAFTASTINSLEEAARGRAVTRRGQDKTAEAAAGRLDATLRGQDLSHADRVAAQKAKARDSRTATGAKRVSQDKHLEYQTSIQSIASYAQKYKGKLSRAQIVQKLTQGRPQTSGYADAQGNPVPKTTPGARPYTLTKIPQFAPDLKMTAALDVALDGHLSRATLAKLARAGFVIKDLNLPTYGQYKSRGGSQQSYDQRRRAGGRRAAAFIPAAGR